MKTPREILLQRHSAAVPALDAIRARAVARIARKEKPDPRSPGTFIEFLISLRWHAAAITALLLLAALLTGEPSPKPRLPVAESAGTPSPDSCILALRRYERELDAMDAPPPREAPAPIPHACADPRREPECRDFA